MEVPPDHVELASFVPRSISADSAFLPDIRAYVRGDYPEAARIAGELGRDLNTGRKLGVSVSKGSVLTTRVEIPRLSVEDPTDTMVWEGEPVNATYTVHNRSEATALKCGDAADSTTSWLRDTVMA